METLIIIIALIIVLYIANGIAHTAINTKEITKQNNKIIKLLEEISQNESFEFSQKNCKL
ncbi:MAG: hypothetical protein KAG98_05800 [Lentisphaeria bacterium]|nr:hypothetical protein [Lentisphaeria bacterium]